MAILKIRGADGVVREVVALRGEKGSGGGASNARELTYDGADEYINATNVEEALKKTSNAIIGMIGEISNKASYHHTHEASDINKIVFVDGKLDPVAQNVGEAIDYLVSQVGDVSRVFDELHAYAQALIHGGGTE